MQINKNPIIKKALLASLNMFYERIMVPNANGDKSHIPMIMGSSKDRQWDKDNFHKEYACGIEDKEFVDGAAKPLPRGTIKYSVFQVDLSEYINDNVKVKTVESSDLGEDKDIYFRVRMIPITIPLTLEIEVENENEKFWVCEALLEFLEKEMEVKMFHNKVKNIPLQIIPELGASSSTRDSIDMSSAKENMRVEMKFNLKFPYPKILGSKYKNQIEDSEVNTSPK